MASRDELLAFHDEVVAALEAAAPAGDVGERIRVDRGSALPHLGLRTPIRRRLVKAGFSFYSRSEVEVLQIWDEIWRTAAYADALSAVLDYYRERLPVEVPAAFWPVAVEWIVRVDNWAHADDLSRVYSWALAAHPDVVYPSLVRWNDSEGEWCRRVSIVSLIHYSGRNAVFLPPHKVLPLVDNCLGDPRPGIQKAVGWVLREMATVYPDDVIGFVEENRSKLSATARRRATDRLDPSVRARLRR